MAASVSVGEASRRRHGRDRELDRSGIVFAPTWSSANRVSRIPGPCPCPLFQTAHDEAGQASHVRPPGGRPGRLPRYGQAPDRHARLQYPVSRGRRNRRWNGESRRLPLQTGIEMLTVTLVPLHDRLRRRWLHLNAYEYCSRSNTRNSPGIPASPRVYPFEHPLLTALHPS